MACAPLRFNKLEDIQFFGLFKKKCLGLDFAICLIFHYIARKSELA